MNEQNQRKFFNFLVLKALVKQLRYSYGSPAYRKKVESDNLKKTMEIAYNIPFYKKRFDEAGVKPEDIKTAEDLRKLPLLTKKEFRLWMDEERQKEENRFCMKSYTSGSTGLPMTILFSPREYATDIANIVRAWKVAGYNAFTGKTLTRISDHSESIGYKTLVQRLGILRREYVKQFAPEEEVIRTINTYKPTLLQMNKSELMRIAVYSKRQGVEVYKPKFYMPLGENIDDLALKTLTEVYGDGLISCYGCAEMGTVCERIPGRTDFLIFGDIAAINIYDDHNQLANEGRIILTTLYRDRFPLINYEVGDRGILDRTEDRAYLVKIWGRQDDVLKFRNGKTTAYTSLWPIVARCEDILQVRFIQKSYERIVVQIVQSPVSRRPHAEIESFLNEELQKKCWDKVCFEFDWMDVIPPDPNGKIRMIVNQMEENKA